MIDQIQPVQLAAWAASHAAQGPVVVLDVREPWEVQTASVRPEGFELLTIPMSTVPANLQDLPRDRPIACLCHHGARSMQVARFLVSNGFAEVSNIAGGIDAWSLQVDPALARY